jgi:hypothetical protein
MPKVLVQPGSPQPLYDPLDATKQEIRIVSILPGQKHEHLSCELFTVSLLAYRWNSVTLEDYYLAEHDGLYSVPYATEDEYAEAQRQHGLPIRACSSQIMAFRRARDPESGQCETELDIPSCDFDPCRCFQALSYAWGLFTKHRSITVNGHYAVPVSDNCYAALLRLRNSKRSRRLWIDAICINQADLVERASQVQMMGQLYSSAPEVLVWLGEADIDQAWERVAKEYPRIYTEQTGEGEGAARWQMMRLALGEIEAKTTANWFFRSWIVQEVVNAKYAPKIQLGSFEGTWLDLIRSFLRPPGTLNIQKAVYGLDSLRSGSREGRSIIDFLDSIRQRDCLDSRDKVYSLLGMVRTTEFAIVEVSYSDNAKPAHVYAQATYASIVGDNSLRAFAFICPEEQQPPDLPSWAVDFSSKAEFELGTLYSPVAWTSHRPHVEPVASLHSNILTIRGLFFDQIADVVSLTGNGNKWPKEYANFSLDHECAESIETALKCLPMEDPYSLVNTSSQATLCPDWTNVLSCANRNLCTKKAEQALRYDRFHRDDLFAEWDRAVSLRQRCSVPDYRDISERDYTMGLAFGINREETAKDRTFVVTKCGFLGLGLRDVKAGDVVALLYGSRLPAILHPLEGSRYTFVGLALINGISYGEMREFRPSIDLPECDFRIQ